MGGPGSGHLVDSKGAERVLILAPMTSELRPVIRGLHARRTLVRGITAYEANQPGKRLLAARIGVGAVRARETTTRLVEAIEPDRVVLTGIAGGIDLSLPVNTLVLPEVVVDLASGRQVRPSPLPDPVKKRLPGAVPGRLATTEQLIIDNRLDDLRDQGFAAIDMETAAVGEVCEDRGIAWWVFRVLSDRPDDGLVDDEVMKLLKPDGSANVTAALSLVARHPGRIPKLMRLARDQSTSTSLAALSALTAIGAV